MNIQTEKLNLIEDLIQVNDEELIRRIRKLLESVPLPTRRMSLKTFLSKIDASEKAIEAGAIVSQEELRKQVKTWRKK